MYYKDKIIAESFALRSCPWKFILLRQERWSARHSFKRIVQFRVPSMCLDENTIAFDGGIYVMDKEGTKLKHMPQGKGACALV